MKKASLKKDKRKERLTQMQRAIAKFAFAIGQIQPIADMDSFECIHRALMLHLAFNCKLVKKYIMMGYSARKTSSRKAGFFEYLADERKFNRQRILTWPKIEWKKMGDTTQERTAKAVELLIEVGA